jgi:hypothetical protein
MLSVVNEIFIYSLVFLVFFKILVDALLGGNKDIDPIKEESNKPKIEIFNKSNNQSNQSNTEQYPRFMMHPDEIEYKNRDSSFYLIGLTIDRANQLIINNTITHDGKQIKWIIDSGGSICCNKGNCIVQTTGGVITKIVENY